MVFNNMGWNEIVQIQIDTCALGSPLFMRFWLRSQYKMVSLNELANGLFLKIMLLCSRGLSDAVTMLRERRQ